MQPPAPGPSSFYITFISYPSLLVFYTNTTTSCVSVYSCVHAHINSEHIHLGGAITKKQLFALQCSNYFLLLYVQTYTIFAKMEQKLVRLKPDTFCQDWNILQFRPALPYSFGQYQNLMHMFNVVAPLAHYCLLLSILGKRVLNYCRQNKMKLLKETPEDTATYLRHKYHTRTQPFNVQIDMSNLWSNHMLNLASGFVNLPWRPWKNLLGFCLHFVMVLVPCVRCLDWSGSQGLGGLVFCALIFFGASWGLRIKVAFVPRQVIQKQAHP